MMKLAAWLIAVGALTSGCAGYGTSDHEQSGQHEPVDRNRNGVPDSLERRGVPMEPIVDRPMESSDQVVDSRKRV